MKRLISGYVFAIFLLGIFAYSGAWAYSYGDNITISDANLNNNSAWYSDKEDQEVEPGMRTGQSWDLEGFFFDGVSLSMIGGYDFKDGFGGFKSGDIFIDVNGDAEFGDIHDNSTNDTSVTDTFGYDYVFDLDFSKFGYSLYELGSDTTTTLTTFYYQNQGSNPWRYESGGTLLGEGSFGFSEGLTDTDVGGLAGGYHYAVTDIDLSFLAGSDFIAHFTMECGNDNLMGAGTVPTPEPASMILLGTGLLGAFGIRRKVRRS